MADKTITNLSSNTDFDKTISQGVALIDFWAPWCAPCKMQLPVLEELARETEDGVIIGKVDIDESIDIAGKFDVQAIPTLILFKNGNEVQRFIGVQSKETLSTEIAKTL